MDTNKKLAKIIWGRRLFSKVPPNKPQRLFSEIPEKYRGKLFENLNDRLEIKSNGEIGVKRNVHEDGYFPIIIAEEPEQALKPEPEPELVPLGGKVSGAILNVVTERTNFSSGNFSLRLTGLTKLVDESDGKAQAILVYIFAICMDESEFEQEVHVEELENITWVKKATSGRAYFTEKKDYMRFSQYVHEVIERDIPTAERKIIYALSGWKKIRGKLRYVCHKGIVGEAYAGISAAGDMKFETLTNISRRECIQRFLDMQEICRKRGNSQSLMVFVNMSVMTTLFELAGFPIKFLMAVLGTTNTMKTSVAVVFSKIFNARETTGPEITFSSTRAGIETYVAKFADAILLVDDFMPGDDKAKQSELNAKMEFLCRAYGDRASKKRMAVFSDRKEVNFPVRGCCMVTGELMTGVQSSRSRVVSINFEKGDVNPEALAFYQDNPLILPTYLKYYLDFISKYVEDILGMIKTKMQEYRANLHFQVARLNEAAAHFLTTLDVMEFYWKSEYPGSVVAEMMEEWRENIIGIFRENEKTLSTVDAGTVILQALEEAIANGTVLLKALDLMKQGDGAIAYTDENFIYIQQKDLYIIVKNYCAKYDVQNYLQLSMIAQKLDEKGLLDCKKNEKGHVERARKLKQSCGNARRYLYIKKKEMKDLLDKVR